MIESFILFKILLPTIAAFIIGIITTPVFSHIFYRYKLWKRSSRIDKANTGHQEMSKEFAQIHNQDETKTPRVGGVIIWFSIVLSVLATILASSLIDNPGSESLVFISRNQTLIPFMSLILGALVGLTDDLLQIFGSTKHLHIGIPRRIRIAFVLFLGAIIGIWFYYRLGFEAISLPFGGGEIFLGMSMILFIMLTVLSLFSSGVIDGVDGLAGGVFGSIFFAYGLIGIIQSQFDIATFCFVVVGAILAFLWFNTPPARFYLGETGVMALTLSLASIIFLTDTVIEFLIIGFPLVLTSFSSLVQIISRRFFNKRVFIVAPFHHHLERLGWSRAKITMRYWIISVMCAVAGVVITIIG